MIGFLGHTVLFFFIFVAVTTDLMVSHVSSKWSNSNNNDAIGPIGPPYSFLTFFLSTFFVYTL